MTRLTWREFVVLNLFLAGWLTAMFWLLDGRVREQIRSHAQGPWVGRDEERKQ